MGRLQCLLRTPSISGHTADNKRLSEIAVCVETRNLLLPMTLCDSLSFGTPNPPRSPSRWAIGRKFRLRSISCLSGARYARADSLVPLRGTSPISTLGRNSDRCGCAARPRLRQACARFVTFPLVRCEFIDNALKES